MDKNGVLYIFELKRWESRSENLLQVLRYGQKFGRYTYRELEDLTRRHGRLDPKRKEELRVRHAAIFGIEPLEESDFNRDQVFVLVTNGADEDTISAINYWSGKGLKVVCVPYWVYEINREPYLELRPYNPAGEVVVERGTNYFVVNTNETNLPGVWKEMIDNSKAAAYYERKGDIRKIPERAVVFLYHTGVGVIAKGRSTSTFQRTNFDGEEDAEFYVPLEFRWVLKKKKKWPRYAPTAAEINRKLNISHRFRRTVFAISEEMATAIDDIASENGVGQEEGSPPTGTRQRARRNS